MILAAAAQRLYNWAAAGWACNYNSASIIYICRILRWVLCLLLMYNYSWLASVISKLLVEEQKYPVVVLCTLIAELNHLLLWIDQLNLRPKRLWIPTKVDKVSTAWITKDPKNLLLQHKKWLRWLYLREKFNSNSLSWERTKIFHQLDSNIMDRNQLQIIEELVRTEQNYVKDLQDVVQVRKSKRENVLHPTKIKASFWMLFWYLAYIHVKHPWL